MTSRNCDLSIEAATGALAEAVQLSNELNRVFAEVRTEFDRRELDMTMYQLVSERLKRQVDEFYSDYP